MCIFEYKNVTKDSASATFCEELSKNTGSEMWSHYDPNFECQFVQGACEQQQNKQGYFLGVVGSSVATTSAGVSPTFLNLWGRRLSK